MGAVSAPRDHALPKGLWKAVLPIAVTVGLLLLPAPSGLAEYAWRYFAIFAGVVVGLVLEPLPGGAVGLIGVAAVTTFAPYTLFSRQNSRGPDSARRTAR